MLWRMETTPLPSAILETCLDVANLARSRDFYTGLFGYPLMKSDDRFCAFAIGERQVLILFRRGSDPQGTALPFGFIPAHGGSGVGHIGFSIPAASLPAWLSRLAEHGVPIESSFTWPTGGTSVYFRDPDGHLLELLTPGVWPIY
jgi:catechol 2,3-dioxygenase-like lactoylglutathione lyase family enzyme